MRELNRQEQIVMVLGAVLMVLGIACVIFCAPLFGQTEAMAMAVKVGTVGFSIGAFLFALIQMSQTYSGTDFVVKRLRRMMIIADICFILAALLLIENTFHIIYPFVATSIDGYNAYVHYVYNNWVIALLIAAILEMYSTHRIAHHLSRHNSPS